MRNYLSTTFAGIRTTMFYVSKIQDRFKLEYWLLGFCMTALALNHCTFNDF